MNLKGCDRKVRMGGERKEGAGERSGYPVKRGLKQHSRGEGQRRGPAEREGNAERGQKGVHLRGRHKEGSRERGKRAQQADEGKLAQRNSGFQGSIS